jgi:3-deoxy-manno-octulosonate cytidylyltransferase (CMP-KDO synthetase)
VGVPTVAVIPARYGSTRFPGKPLVDLAGVPMIVRVAQRASAARLVDMVLVATDDHRIERAVVQAGFRAVMTPSDCASGTDRVYLALERAGVRDVSLVVNVQGDEPLIDPTDIDVLVACTLESGCGMGTLARPITDEAVYRDPHVVKVVVNRANRALYFSRAPIPSGADFKKKSPMGPLQHVGIYAYRPDVLREMASLPRSDLEGQESLEQLRALENGIPMLVAGCVSLTPSIAIDRPEDVDRVLRLLTNDPRSRRSQEHGIQH